jgi:hypothetical protein
MNTLATTQRKPKKYIVGKYFDNEFVVNRE